MKRDFSASTESTLISNIRNVAPEAAIKLSGKRAFGSYSDLVSELGLSSAISSGDTYSQQVSERNTKEKEEIQKIFDGVQEIDGNFGQLLKAANDELVAAKELVTQIKESVSVANIHTPALFVHASVGPALENMLRAENVARNGALKDSGKSAGAIAAVKTPADFKTYLDQCATNVAAVNPYNNGHSKIDADLIKDINEGKVLLLDLLMDEGKQGVKFGRNTIKLGTAAVDIIKGTHLAFTNPQLLKQLSQIRVNDLGGYVSISNITSNRDARVFSELKKILGNRYKIGSDKFKNLKLDRLMITFAPDATWKSRIFGGLKNEFTKGDFLDDMIGTKAVKEFKNASGGFQRFSKGLDVTGKVFSLGSIAYDMVSTGISKSQSGASGTEVFGAVAERAVFGAADLAVGVAASKIGAAIGTAIPIPGVGTAVGAVAGFAIGVAGSALVKHVSKIKIGNHTVSEHVANGIAATADFVGNTVSGAANAVGGFFKGLFGGP